MPSRRRGNDFEELIGRIEAAVGIKDGRRVEVDKRLRHNVTGVLRQFDVVVTFPLGHHTFVTAVECKDQRRPVDVKEIEAFATKIAGCPINRGCVVARAFTRQALALAQANKIACITIAEIDTWLVMSIQHLVLHGDVRVYRDTDSSESGLDVTVREVSNGQIWTQDELKEGARQFLIQLGWTGDNKQREATIEALFEADLIYGDRTLRVPSFYEVVRFSWEEESRIPFDCYGYSGDGVDIPVASNFVDVEKPDGSGYEQIRLVVVRPEEGLRVVTSDNITGGTDRLLSLFRGEGASIEGQTGGSPNTTEQ